MSKFRVILRDDSGISPSTSEQVVDFDGTPEELIRHSHIVEVLGKITSKSEKAIEEIVEDEEVITEVEADEESEVIVEETKPTKSKKK